jgi:hypothetical protein
MDPIRLDYGPRRGALRWTSVALFSAVALAGVKEVDAYLTARREAIELAAGVERLESRNGHAGHATLPAISAKEIRRANEVIGQIALPWNRLFQALESATGPNVGLLGIAPDQKTGTVQISGEAVDINAMLDYVKRLQRQQPLTNVYLLNHKLNIEDPRRSVGFTVIASWLPKKSPDS